MGSSVTVRLLSAAALLLVPALAAAQGLPDRPLTTLGGTLTVSGEIVATAGAPADTGFFNYTNYEQDALRLFRAGVSAAWRPLDRLAFLAELRSEDLGRVVPFAAYVRVRPWLAHRFDIQAGRIPPVFGAFARRAYGRDNPLVGYPLAYQYLTSLPLTPYPRRPEICCGCAAGAGDRVFRSGRRSLARACRSSTRCGGTPASRPGGRHRASTSARR